MRYSVDRIEPCGCAVLVSETGECRKVSPKEIGFCPGEGDILVQGEDGSYNLDTEDTRARRARLNTLLQRILHRKR